MLLIQMDKYKIDGQKLIFHIKRVNDWLKGKNIYPVYVEISPSGSCNHRCTYCALDFMEYRPKFLAAELLKKRLSEMALLGIKSVMYAGEGEPLLHRDLGEIINHTKNVGIDVALTTNGVLLKRNFVDYALENITWIKVSINGATRDTYAKIHRTNPNDFDKVLENISYISKLKYEKGYKCTLGMQIILLPENYQEISLLSRKAKELGLDYLVVKPYSQHPLSKTTKYKDIKYAEYLHLADDLSSFNDKKFNVIFRLHTMKKWDENKRIYKHCLALPFWSYLDASGKVWGCSAFLTNKNFHYGNIYKNTFKEIWESKRRIKLLRWAERKLETDNCRVNCRMDEVNRYLWELKHPSEHVNFI